MKVYNSQYTPHGVYGLIINDIIEGIISKTKRGSIVDNRPSTV